MGREMVRAAGAFAAAVAVVLVCVPSVVGCSGSSGGGNLFGSSGSSTDPGDGGGAADGGAVTYTLDNVCDLTAPKVCAIRQPCCQSSGTGYDDAGCLAHAKADCQKDVDAARAGQETFHPDRIDACVAKLAPIYQQCSLTIPLLLEAVPTIHDCGIFDGQLLEGASCERDSQCKPSPSTLDLTSCDTTTSECKTTHILSEGEACSIADGLPTICNDGLFCDADFSKTPATGTCKKATALGQKCNTTTASATDLECGFGSYCDRATGVCTAGKPTAAACQSGLECTSLTCTAGACVAPGVLVKPDECNGP